MRGPNGVLGGGGCGRWQVELGFWMRQCMRIFRLRGPGCRFLGGGVETSGLRAVKNGTNRLLKLGIRPGEDRVQ